MQPGTIPLFSLLSGRMTWLSARQAVLSQNVANADTPGYAARDLKEMDFAAMVSGQNTQPVRVTNARHIGAALRGAGVPVPVEVARTSASSVGSTVSLEQEMIKLSDTQVQYQAATNLYQKAVNMFRTALGGRN